MANDKQLRRKDIPKDKTWNLTKIYKNIDEWEKDYLNIDTLLDKVLSYKGNLAESAKKLADAMKTSDELERLAEKLYTYSHLLSDEDISNSKNQGYLDKITAKFADISGETAWFEPELIAISKTQMNAYLETDELSFYKRSIKDMLKARPHILSDKEERLLGLASDIFSASHKTFSMLNNADISFPNVIDENKNEIKLTHGNYIKFLENNNREVRKSAFDAMYDTFKQYRNTLASTLDATVKKHAYNAKIREYDSSLVASLFSDKVPVDVYNSLIDTVNENINSVHKYYELRRKSLKLDKLDMYDVYCPLVSDIKVDISWDEACQWVLEAMQPMGKEYCEIVKKCFSNRWIDVLESKGKRSGAYSSGCYDSPPYILMNYNNTLNSVFTLAHELGHSMHSFYSNKTQDYHYASYSIFVAEVASTTNELLLYDYLLKKFKDNTAMITYLMNYHADGIRSTVVRQTMFAEFEKIIHQQSESQIPLTPDNLSKIYYDLNKKYHGDAVQTSQKIDMEWARIPHFYYNFYVYKYATGFSAALALSQNILSGDKNKINKYFDFLKAGDSLDVLDIMKHAGVDLTSSEPVEKTMKELSNTVYKLEQLI